MWHRFAAYAESAGERSALVDAHTGLTLTYRDLHDAAVEQSRLLHGHGVRAGDAVLLEVPRSAAEAVAVLGVLRLGAHYVAVDQHATAEWRTHLAATVAARARLGVGEPWPGVVDCPLVDPRTPVGQTRSRRRRATGAHRVRLLHVRFDGRGQGVVVPHRAVLRLADDPGMFAERLGMRMLRLSPLAFDASTLELLVPWPPAKRWWSSRRRTRRHAGWPTS
ncbi:AMP-binding protein [Micromonospora sp. M12]